MNILEVLKSQGRQVVSLEVIIKSKFDLASLIATLSWPKYYYNQKGFTHTQQDSGFGDEKTLVGLRQQPALQRSLCKRNREPSEQENGSQRPWTQNDLLQTVKIIILIIWITSRLRAHEPI